MTKYKEGKVSGTDPEARLRSYGWTERLHIEALGPCWDWNGPVFRGGYGRVKFQYKSWSAHRLAFTVWVGPIPEGQVVRHRCDNRMCIRPIHLELGTTQDNVQDRYERGRCARGASNGNAKLNPDAVRDIRARAASGESNKSISERYGVTAGAIYFVIQLRTWRHVT